MDGLRIMRSLTDESGIGSSSNDRISGISPGLNPWSCFPGLAGDPSEAMGSSQMLSPIQREILADFPWLHQRRLVNPTSASKDESDVCTSSVREPTPTDQVAWAQSVLALQACENSETPESLSSSLSDELQKGNGEDTCAQSGKRKREHANQETKKPMNRPRKKGGAKRVREPRYAIRTRTDTQVMDDGYKWRKYGQKAVKNSPHPRNYYRCTTPNCPVRKRVERCFEDPTLVVTTYEGTHTHQSPSFLRGPPAGYPGGLQALLATLSHQYTLAGNAALPPFGHSSGSAGFQFPGLSFSKVSGLGYNSLGTNSSVSDQLGGSQLNPLQYSSLMRSAGPFPSQPPPFSRHPDYAEPGAALDENYSQGSTGASKDHGGLLEDMFRSTKTPHF